MSNYCPTCGSGLAVYGPAGETRFVCNVCGWHFPNSAPRSQQFTSSLEIPGTGTTATDSTDRDSVSEVQRASETRRQIPLDQIFRGDSWDAKLKRVIGLRYISSNPTQLDLVEWLQARKLALPSSWQLYHFDDWADAWKTKANLVKRFLSGITGKLRQGGYQVGRFYST